VNNEQENNEQEKTNEPAQQDGASTDGEFKLTVRKLEMPVRPRGVLAE
jgi:hypothetical protein